MSLSASPPVSPLLHIPPETRLPIYRHLLLCDAEIQLPQCVADGTLRNSVFQPYPVIRTHLDIHPCILRSCRLIYNEALPILYAENWFRWSSIVEKHPHASLIKRCQYRIRKHNRCYFPHPSQWDSQYNCIVYDLAKCPKFSPVIIYVAGLEDPGTPVVWNLGELAQALIRTEVVGDVVFRPDWSYKGKRKRFNEEEKVELKKVVDAVKVANRSI